MNMVDDYIANFPEETRRILNKIREIIKKEAPDAVETIRYDMPTFVLNGNLIHFAAFKKHIGIYPSPRGDAAFQEEIKPFRGAKSTIRLPLDKPLPEELISKLVKFRILEQNRL
ncbi:MAG: DUF1801 domain-containing protein [Bacteroidota bacterium]|nr:DUF1801 domain-containing protein [Bacteroidota bacterium]